MAGVLYCSADEILKAGSFPDVAVLKSRWEAERSAWFDYVTGLADESINAGYGDGRRKVMVWHTILQVAHGIQHRSEAAAILTKYGQSPGELYFDLFLEERPEFLHG